MLKAVPILSLALLTVPFGCSSEQTTESISGVVPSEAFIGRQTDVVILGSGTNWSEDARINFGNGIVVEEMTVASPSSIRATITVAPSALLGPRDVLVNDGGEFSTLTDGFSLDSPISISVEGDLAQGSIAIVKVKNLDTETPFDTTSEGGVFGPASFPNIDINLGERVSAQVSSVEPFALEFVLLADVNAQAGPRDLEIVSGPAETQVSFGFPRGATISERTATPLTAGTPLTTTFSAAHGSALYSVTPSSLAILDIALGTTAEEAAGSMALLPASGSFDDLVSFGAAATLATDETHYLVYWDSSGAAGYDYQLAVSELLAASMHESEPNNTPEGAMTAASMPLILQSASIADAADEDWIEVEITEANVGKAIRIMTYGDDPQTDVAVDVLAASDMDTSLLDGMADANFHEDVTTGPIAAAGTYFVKIVGSPGFFNPEHSAYDAAVFLID